MTLLHWQSLPRAVAMGAVLVVAAQAQEPAGAPPALKEVFAGRFRMGTALADPIVMNPDHPARALVARHFGVITPAGMLKWARYNPEPGRYVLEPMDALVALAEANRQQIVGHVLFWHQQTPPWVFQDESGAPVSRAVLLERMRERTRHVAQRYGRKITSWDVINETFEDDGSLRDSPWTRLLGADFIPEAFRIAQEELPPGATLIYNDYNMYKAGRRTAVVQMIGDLRARGLRIDAVGMQGHWTIDVPAVEEIEASLLAFSGAGVRVHITELDVDVLPRDPSMFGADISRRAERTPENDPYVDGLSDEMQERLAERYGELFRLFVRHADAIDRVTFWGVTDADSWLNNFPVRGRTNHALLFDREGKAKEAFDAVVRASRSDG